MEGERLSWRVSLRAEARSKTSQKDKSVTLECKTDKTALEHEAIRRTSAQQIIDMIVHNIHGHAKHRKKVPKKSMIQRALKQTLNNIKTDHILCVQQQSMIQYMKIKERIAMQGMLQSVYTNPHQTSRR